ncbi:MAG: T9SS type A sorting domain-containing protein [Flavobacterium haoranii]
MKKLLLYVFLIINFITVNAQYFEGFESGVPGTMTQQFISGFTSWGSCGGTLGGSTCPVMGTASASFYLGNYNANSTALVTPTLDLSTGSWILKFKHSQRSWSGDINELHVEISTDDGTNWTTIISYLDDIQAPTQEIINLGPYSLTTTTKIRFRAVNNYGYSLILDDVEVAQNTVSNDAELTSTNLTGIMSQGNFNISGLITNQGNNTISSIDINWQADGGNIYTQNLTGLNILPGGTYNFNHTTAWNATIGSHSLNVWVSNTNGGDSNAANNQLSYGIAVASNATTRFPLFEKFTSSTCSPCASFNSGTFNPFYNTNSSRFNLINYQMNWPGSGDPYYTAEGGTRRSFYNVTSVPDFFFDGKALDCATLEECLQTQEALPAYFNISATYSLTGSQLTVNTSTIPYLDGTYNLQVVVVEKITTGNISTNGETSFKNVMMKMLPDANGTSLNCTHEVVINNTFSTDLSTTNFEEYSDLEVVILVQNSSSKEVMQSAKALNVLGNNSFDSKNEITLYPNPSNGIISLKSETNVNLEIFDITGKIVFTKEILSPNESINVSFLNNGMYFAKMKNENGEKIQKISIK